jgi:peptide chain release factor 1
VSVLFQGFGARNLFSSEGGGHRWQRIPPNEKKGRVHTSTITVAVLDPDSGGQTPLKLKDVEIVPSRGGGPGGQHRNKTESCITAIHLPTGISVRIDMRSQHQSRSIALKILSAKLKEMSYNSAVSGRNENRRRQLGSGQRGDKIRTYRSQDDRVTDHRTGKTWSLKSWARGEW